MFYGKLDVFPFNLKSINCLFLYFFCSRLFSRRHAKKKIKEKKKIMENFCAEYFTTKTNMYIITLHLKNKIYKKCKYQKNREKENLNKHFISMNSKYLFGFIFLALFLCPFLFDLKSVKFTT